MSSWFGLILALLVLFVSYGIVRSVRMVMSDLNREMKAVPRAKRDEASRLLAKSLKELDVRCPRCGQEAFMVMGTADGYKCDGCSHEFKGPPLPRITDTK